MYKRIQGAAILKMSSKENRKKRRERTRCREEGTHQGTDSA